MASSSTTSSTALDAALYAIPTRFRSKIIQSYLELKRRYSEAVRDAAWDASGLSAGKFCEAVLRFLQWQLTGTHIPFGKAIPHFENECRNLGTTTPQSAGVESLRLIIPRALIFLYTLRNKRGIGHVGGDVEANEIDAATTARLCDWVVCELVRIFHGLSLEEAQVIVDALAERVVPTFGASGERHCTPIDQAARPRVTQWTYSAGEREMLLGVIERALTAYRWLEQSFDAALAVEGLDL